MTHRQQDGRLNSVLYVPCSLVQLARVVVVCVMLVGVLGVMVVILIGRHSVGEILVAIFKVTFCIWRCTLQKVRRSIWNSQSPYLVDHGATPRPIDTANQDCAVRMTVDALAFGRHGGQSWNGRCHVSPPASQGLAHTARTAP